MLLLVKLIINKNIIYIFKIHTWTKFLIGSRPNGLQSFCQYINKNPTVAVQQQTKTASTTFFQRFSKCLDNIKKYNG